MIDGSQTPFVRALRVAPRVEVVVHRAVGHLDAVARPQRIDVDANPRTRALDEDPHRAERSTHVTRARTAAIAAAFNPGHDLGHRTLAGQLGAHLARHPDACRTSPSARLT